MLVNRFFLMDEANDGAQPPAAGGGASSTPAGSDVNWEAESDLSTESEAPEAPVTPAATPTPPVAPAAPTAAPAPAAPAVPPVAAPAPVPAATPPQPAAAPTPAPVVADAPQPTPAAPAAPVDLPALRAKEVERLTGLYALNQEDAANIVAQPETVVPKMLANLHVNVCDAVVNAIMSRLPETVQAVMQQGNTAKEAEDAFFGKWPQLKDTKYRQTVERAIVAARQVNPAASRDEMIQAAGVQAMIALRIPLPAELFTPPQAAAPTAPAVPSFQHAAPAAGGGAPTPRPSTNPFVLLNEELDAEERA